MLPTIPLAMVTLLTGYGSLAFMWFQDSLTLQALGASLVLFFVGVAMGWGQVRYERYLVRTCPEYLARKQKVLDAAKEYKRPKRDLPVGGPHHPGRQVVLLAYALGVFGYVGAVHNVRGPNRRLPGLFSSLGRVFERESYFLAAVVHLRCHKIEIHLTSDYIIAEPSGIDIRQKIRT